MVQFCRHCGTKVSDENIPCTNCGVLPLNNNKFCQACASPTRPAQEVCVECGAVLLAQEYSDTGATPLVKISACLFPLVGLILYLVWKDEKPQSATTACRWALIGVLLNILAVSLGFCSGLVSIVGLNIHM